jgi:hypothetical protein
MSQLIKEQLSAFVDGELPIEEEELLLKQLEKSAEYRAVLGRYTLMAELIRDPSTDPDVLRISERIRMVLLEEASHSSEPPRSNSSMVVKGLVGAGIAACVAVLALISLNPFERDSGSVPPLAELQANTDSYVVPVHSDGGQMAITPARLTNYLVSHGEFFNGPSRLTIDSHFVGGQGAPLAVPRTEAMQDD